MYSTLGQLERLSGKVKVVSRKCAMITHWHQSWKENRALLKWRLACRALTRTNRDRTKRVKMNEMMLKWNSNKRRRITIGQSLCRDGSRGARCHAIRYDTMVWSRLCGVSDMRDKQGVPCNNVPHQSQLISTTDDGILVLVSFFSAAVPGEDQSVGDAEPRAARISVGSLFYRSII